jgi:WD40 repeat protein
VNRLPERLRRVVVLCELHGASLSDAAAQLRCPVGTVASRLARAREQLRAMLSGRGLAVGAVGGAVAVELVPPDVRAAALRLGGSGADVRLGVAALARRASSPAWAGMSYGLAAAFAAGLAAVAVALGTQREPRADPKPPAKDPPPPAAARTEAEDGPLPAGAVARLGSARFRFDGGWGPIAFSPDGRRLAAAGRAGAALFDTATGRILHRLPVADGHDVRVIRFLSDGKSLAVGARGRPAGDLTVFGLADGRPRSLVKFPGKNEVSVIDVAPDGSRALVVDQFAKAYLWDVGANREVWAFDHEQGTSVLPFTANGKRFVVTGGRTAELRDAATGKVVATFPNPGPAFADGLFGVELSGDGRIAVAAHRENVVAVLAAEGKERARTLPADRRTEQFLFSPDARYLVGLTWLATQVWDLTAADDTGPVARLPAATGAGFAPNGKTLALAGEGYLTLWTVGDWKRLPQSADPASPVRRVRFTPDGKYVLGYTGGGWVKWPAGGGPATRISDDSPIYPQALADLSADGRFALDVLCKPGKGADEDKYALRVTDLATGTDRRIPIAGTPWDPLQISPDGRHVSALVAGSEFVVWDARSGAVLHRQKWAQESFLYGATPTPDGSGLARSVVAVSLPGVRGPVVGGSRYLSVTVTDHTTGRKWDLHPVPSSIYVGGGKFSRDGTRLVLHGHFDSPADSVSVWDARTGRRLMNWARGAGPVGRVTPAADYRSLLFGDAEGKLALIEVATGGERAAFRHGGQVLSSAFHPDGTKAVASSPEAPVYVWDLLGDAGKWDAAKADAVWADLASTDAKVAFGAIRKLRANPIEAVPFLRDRIKLPPIPSDETVTGLLKRLDAPAFADRQRAQKELTAVADLIRPRLETARKAEKSEEVARRLDQILKPVDEMTPDRLRQVRACEVLEGIRTADAVGVLRTWAAGPTEARLTIEARESLDRLKP